MNEIVTINNQQVDPIEYDGQRVVTFAMVDRLHQRPDGTAKRNFSTNRDKFVEKADYYELTSYEIRTMSDSGAFPARSARGTLLTQSGYLMLCKSLTDDLSWTVQRELVNSYFSTARAPESSNLPAIFNDPATLLKAIEEYARERLRLEEQISEMRPKVRFADRVANSTNLQTVQEVAKILGIGPNKLFDYLKEEKIFMWNNLPYQQFIDRDYFEVRERVWTDKDGTDHTYSRTFFTGKGLIWLQKRMQATTELVGAA